jgi:hypothetical protein
LRVNPREVHGERSSVPEQTTLGVLKSAAKDADESFWFDEVGKVVQTCSSDPPPTVISQQKTHWIEIALVDQEGNPVSGQNYEITLPGGSIVTGSLDSRGVTRIEGIDPGTCKIRFPMLDKDSWGPGVTP